MRWWRRRNGDTHARDVQQAKLRQAERETPAFRRLADEMADLTTEELATRLRQALTVRHP